MPDTRFLQHLPVSIDNNINFIELNEGQEQAVQTIMASATGKSKKTQFILIGPGGSGKTTVYHKIVTACKELIFLEGGRTVHSGFRNPEPTENDSISFVKLQSTQAEDLRKSAVLMIDEVSQMSTYSLRVIDLLLRALMYNDEPLGGKTVVFGRDFRQLFSVVPNGQRTHIVAASVTPNPLWSGLQRLELIQKMHAQHDVAFSNWLLELGCGSLSATVGLSNRNYIKIPDWLLLQVPSKNPASRILVAQKTMIGEIFGTDMHKLDSKRLSELVILASTNEEVLQMNNVIVESLPGVEVSYLSVDEIISQDPKDIINYAVEFLNKRTPSGMPPHQISSKEGVIVVLLRNIRPFKGLRDGKRLQVTTLTANASESKIISETCCVDIVNLFRDDVTANDNSLSWQIRRLQSPIIPVYAMTINKSQRRTLDKVGIHLSNSVSAHGELYVALFRCRNGRNIIVHVSPFTDVQRNLLGIGAIFIQNLVYRELFVHNEMKPALKPFETLCPNWQASINQAMADWDAEELMESVNEELMDDEDILYRVVMIPRNEGLHEHVAMREVNEMIDNMIFARLNIPMEQPQQSDDIADSDDENFDDEFFEENYVDDLEAQYLEEMESAPAPNENQDFHEFIPVDDVGDQGGAHEPVDVEPGTGQRLLIFNNRCVLFDNEELINMCSHNSLVHGFVYLFKREETVRNWMEEKATLSEYFRIVVRLIGEPNDGARNSLWGAFVKQQCGAKINDLNKNHIGYEKRNLAADVTDVVDWSIDNHVSFVVTRRDGPRAYISLMLGQTDWNGLKFSDAIINSFHGDPEDKIEFGEVLLISLEPGKERALHEITRYFEHKDHKYRLKFVIRFIPGHLGHYICYAHDFDSETWLELDDFTTREVPFPAIYMLIQPSLLMYSRL